MQNVKAIEDMRELLLQEHSLTIKVYILFCCTIARSILPSAHAFYLLNLVAWFAVYHHSLAPRAGPVPGSSPARAGVRHLVRNHGVALFR